MKTVFKAGDDTRMVRVQYNPEFREYVAKLYTNGKHCEPVDYFDTDKESAILTANAMLAAA